MTYNVFGGMLNLAQSLSHWVHFIVRRFICVYLCVFCVFFFILHSCCIIVSGGVDLVGLKPNP